MDHSRLLRPLTGSCHGFPPQAFTTWLCASLRSSEDAFALGKGWTLLQRLCLIKSGPSSKIFHLINSKSIQEKPYLYLQKSLPSCYSMELIQESEIPSCLQILSTMKERGLPGTMHYQKGILGAITEFYQSHVAFPLMACDLGKAAQPLSATQLLHL